MATRSSKSAPTQENASAELEKLISAAQYGSISSFEDALALAESVYGSVLTAVELGDGFSLCKDKDTLINTPLLVLDTQINKSDKYDSDWVTVRLVASGLPGQPPRKLIVTDGSTGICAQVKTYRDKTGARGGWAFPHGFTKSEYDYVDKATGETTPAVTYYFSEDGS